MKKLIFCLNMLILSSHMSFAQNYPIYNSYSPTYKNVVVLYDTADKEFYPFFFHLIQGELLDMSIHDSCKMVTVAKMGETLSVICNSKTKKQVVVGTLVDSKRHQGFSRIYNVNWNSNSEIVQFVNSKDKSLSYSVVVK
jgi:hypothetical protein